MGRFGVMLVALAFSVPPFGPSTEVYMRVSYDVCVSPAVLGPWDSGKSGAVLGTALMPATKCV